MAVTAVLALLVCEVFGHLAIRAVTGSFLWQARAREHFQIRGFARRVDDDRVFTAIPGFSGGGGNGWDIAFDEAGFRRTVAAAGGSARVVFIGDSVPFGWGVGDAQSVPSWFAALTSGMHLPVGEVINAALPSYSLHQAISRYDIEVAPKVNAGLVVLQIYDPATQFSLFGREWRPEDNWSTQNQKLERIRYKRTGLARALDYSSIAFAYRLVVPKNGRDPRLTHALDPADHATIEAFETRVSSELRAFAGRLAQQGSHLIVLPVVPNNPTALPKRLAVATAALNRGLRAGVDGVANAAFVDVAPALYAAAMDRVFIDDCCHLSPDGARIEAELVIAAAVERQMLAPAH